MRVKRGKIGVSKRAIRRKLAKGFVGGRGTQNRITQETINKGLAYAYVGRKLRKREFRALWIARINAGARANGLSYNRFMEGLRKANIEVDRKVLAEIAVSDKAGFAALVEQAKQTLAAAS